MPECEKPAVENARTAARSTSRAVRSRATKIAVKQAAIKGHLPKLHAASAASPWPSIATAALAGGPVSTIAITTSVRIAVPVSSAIAPDCVAVGRIEPLAVEACGGRVPP
jgi:hypothetical protein